MKDAAARLQIGADAWLTELAPPGAVAVVDAATGAKAVRLPPQAIVATFARYGRPLEIAMPPRAEDDEALEVALPSGVTATVRAFSFRGYGDVLPTDYLALETPGAETVAAPARLVGAALRALARAAAASDQRVPVKSQD